MDWEQVAMSFGDELSHRFGVTPQLRSYAGGTPGMDARLPISQYDEVKNWLTEKFGEPEVMEHWHPQQTRETPPLRFAGSEGYEGPWPNHVNLVSMLQRKGKRYILVAWM